MIVHHHHRQPNSPPTYPRLRQPVAPPHRPPLSPHHHQPSRRRQRRTHGPRPYQPTRTMAISTNRPRTGHPRDPPHQTRHLKPPNNQNPPHQPPPTKPTNEHNTPDHRANTNPRATAHRVATAVPSPKHLKTPAASGNRPHHSYHPLRQMRPNNPIRNRVPAPRMRSPDTPLTECGSQNPGPGLDPPSTQQGVLRQLHQTGAAAAGPAGVVLLRDTELTARPLFANPM